MDDSRFSRAIDAFHAQSSEDPQRERDASESRPRELLQAERLAAWVERLSPDASEALRLAAHCQHVGRHRLPRTSYPEGRSGYLKWRAELARRHAATAESILREVGYDDDSIGNVRRIVLKQNLSSDPEVQTMEDALCLSFLQHEFKEFATRHDDVKLVRIVRKTWGKMSERAREIALTLPLEARELGLVQRALGAGE